MGDSVLVHMLAFDGKYKQADKWQSEPNVVVARPNADISVYEVQLENGTGRKRTLHRNHLLPVSSLAFPVEEHSEHPNIMYGQNDVPEESQSTISQTDQSKAAYTLMITLTPAAPAAPEKKLMETNYDSVVMNIDAHKVVDMDEGSIEVQDPFVNDGKELPVVDVALVSQVHRTTTQVASGSFMDGTVSTPMDEELTSEQTKGPHYKLRRNRQPPKWSLTGDYVMYQCQDHCQRASKTVSDSMCEPDWERKANFLESLAAKHSFVAEEQSFRQAFLNLVADA